MLVRDGYDAAFEEIVRRYGAALHRYTAGIVGGRAEDVTQDAFSKALLALRRDGAEIELRPWLFRIARNTALNDLRDSPRTPERLAEELVHGGSGPAETLERREELAQLIGRLRALPDAQRAAIVMRELEGLGHDEIAATLGVSGGAARQAIHRARTALRDGVGFLLPLPLLRALLASGPSPLEAAAATGAGGAGVALKAATATVLIAGAVGAGVVTHHQGRGQAAKPRPDSLAASRPSPTDGVAGGGSNVTADDASGLSGESRGGGFENHGGGSSSNGRAGSSGGGSGKSSPSGGDRESAGGGADGRGGTTHSGGGGGPGGPSGPGGSGDDGSSGGGGGPGGGGPHSTSGDDSSGGSGSNSGPGSGDPSAEQMSATDDGSDPHGSDVFSVQATQPKEDR